MALETTNLDGEEETKVGPDGKPVAPDDAPAPTNNQSSPPPTSQGSTVKNTAPGQLSSAGKRFASLKKFRSNND